MLTKTFEYKKSLNFNRYFTFQILKSRRTNVSSRPRSSEVAARALVLESLQATCFPVRRVLTAVIFIYSLNFSSDGNLREFTDDESKFAALLQRAMELDGVDRETVQHLVSLLMKVHILSRIYLNIFLIGALLSFVFIVLVYDEM